MINVSCGLYGKIFSPNILKQQIKNVKIINSIEPGEILKIGRYKNSFSPNGSCTLEPLEDISNEIKIEWMADFIDQNRELFKQNNIEEINFSILWIGIQGNMQFSIIELEKIAKLKLPLSITYLYRDDA